MQSIKALQKFMDVVTNGVVSNDKFRDIKIYNMNGIFILDNIKIDDIFYQCKFKMHDNDGIVYFDLATTKFENLEFRIYHKIIKAITDFNENSQPINYSHYYIGNIYYKPTANCIYGDDDNNNALFRNIAVKTRLNDTKTSETIEEIIAINHDKIVLDLLN